MNRISALALLATTLTVGVAALAQTPAPASQTPAPAQAVAPTDPAIALTGKPAPAFELPDQADQKRSLNSRETRDKWIVMAFYPADMTGGCTMQNKSYSANKEKFVPLKAVVYTVSTQDTASKRAFCQRDSLTNVLLSDVTGKIATKYGVLPEGGKYARRVTFYINPKREIAFVDTRPNVRTAAEDSLAKLTELQKATETRTL